MKKNLKVNYSLAENVVFQWLEDKFIFLHKMMVHTWWCVGVALQVGTTVTGARGCVDLQKLSNAYESFCICPIGPQPLARVLRAVWPPLWPKKNSVLPTFSSLRITKLQASYKWPVHNAIFITYILNNQSIVSIY